MENDKISAQEILQLRKDDRREKRERNISEYKKMYNETREGLLRGLKQCLRDEDKCELLPCTWNSEQLTLYSSSGQSYGSYRENFVNKILNEEDLGDVHIGIGSSKYQLLNYPSFELSFSRNKRSTTFTLEK